MPKLSKEETLRRIHVANAIFVDIGLSDIVGGYDNGMWQSVTEYFNYAIRLWTKHKIHESKRKKYKTMHQEYLGTDQWKAKRAMRLEIDAHLCIDCGKPAQCVHHLHYKTWKRENVKSDLVSLCNDCHYKRHFP